MMSKAPRSAVIGAVVAMLLVACGSSSDDSASEPTTTATSADASDTSVAGDTSVTPEPDDPEAPEDVGADLFPDIELGATEPGPRPTLTWTAVDGASIYQLTVLDAAGEPYWSWSGSDTAIPLGGMDNADAVGAWVFEELTWMVVARDAAGVPLGVSRRGVLEP